MCQNRPHNRYRLFESSVPLGIGIISKKRYRYSSSTSIGKNEVYLIRNSERKRYPLHVLKSSRSICETSLESFRKQKTVTNISTSSIGDNSWTRCMLSMHSATQPLPGKLTAQVCYGDPHKI